MLKRKLDPETDEQAIPDSGKRWNLDRNDSRTLSVGIGPKRLAADAYTIGWICAIATEYLAAQVFLDEIHGRPQSLTPHDNNDYTLGRIGDHNVVIAVLGQYGTASAATVARDMQHSFPNVRNCLMVGIGGGAPNRKNDIRLGDVVVSTPQDGHGGVFQYDFGKTMQHRSFRATGFLNQPPLLLQGAVNGLRAQYERDGHCLEEAINDVLDMNRRLWPKYKHPDSGSDRLYHSQIVHPSNEEASCTAVCDEDPTNLVQRGERTGDKLVIHYGLIASANQVMRNASVRDALAAEKNVLCFEMEAAGLMNHFPCLVIRGICDYSDSHKNKAWQGFAAMAAAAYAKDILRRIPPHNDNAHNDSEGHAEDDEILIDDRKERLLESLRFDQLGARQMNIKNAHAKTCKWLLEAPEYIDWLDHGKLDHHNGFLWIKGKPGAGKSTLMKFALLNARGKMRDKTVISFFFNARGDDLEKSTMGMYQSLVLQLLEPHSELDEVFDSIGVVSRSGVLPQWTLESLKELFEQIVRRLGNTPVLCYIDALDECDETQIRDMISLFEHIGELTASADVSFLVCLSSRHYPHITIAKGLELVLEGQEGHERDIVCYLDSKLKIGHGKLAENIRLEIQEKASGVFLWIFLVVEILNKEFDRGRIHALRKKLQLIPGDLYELFRDILIRDDDNRDELILCIQWVLFATRPLRPEQLYFAILANVEPDALSKWNPDEITLAVTKRFIVDSSKGLAEVTRSKTPTVQFIHESVRDFFLKEDGLKEIRSDLAANFQGKSHDRLKRGCLNYMKMDVHKDLNIGSSLPKASSREAAELRRLTEKAFPFLEYAVRNVLHHADAAEAGGVPQAGFLESFPLVDWIKLDNLIERHEIRRHTLTASLLYTLSENNLHHLITIYPFKLCCFEVGTERYGTPIFAALATNSNGAVQALLRAQVKNNPSASPLQSPWKRYDEDFDDEKSLDDDNNLDDDEAFGNDKILDAVPEYGRDFTFVRQRGVLSHLAEKGDEALTTALINSFNEVDVEVKDKNGRTPLSLAAGNGHRAVTKLLLNTNRVNVEAKDNSARTPLMWAAMNGQEGTARLLLGMGHADVEAKDHNGQNALSLTAEKGYSKVLELLLDVGRADVEATDHKNRTALSRAAELGQRAVVELLIEMGRASVDAKDIRGLTALAWAARAGRNDVVQLLLRAGRADAAMKDSLGQTPISLATKNGHTDKLELLLEMGGSGADTKDNDGRTPLSRAAEGGHWRAAELLLTNKRANIFSTDNGSQTPPLWAAANGHADVVPLLSGERQSINWADDGGRTPLSWAAGNGHDDVVRSLLATENIDLDSPDKIDRSPLLWAVKAITNTRAILAGKDHVLRDYQMQLMHFEEQNKKRLIGKRQDVHRPLPRTAWGVKWLAVIELLVERGANIEARDAEGYSPLSWATEKGDTAVVALLQGVESAREVH